MLSTILEVQYTLPLDLTRTHKRHVIDIHEQKGLSSGSCLLELIVRDKTQ